MLTTVDIASRAAYNGKRARDVCNLDGTYTKEEGATYSDPAYMSTSADTGYIAGVLHQNETREESVVFKIASLRGLPVQQTSGSMAFMAQDFEQEVLLPRGNRYRVVGVAEEYFQADPERRDLATFYDYQDFTSRESSSIPAQKVLVVHLVEEGLLQEG